MADDKMVNRAHIWTELVPVWLDAASSDTRAAPLKFSNDSEQDILAVMLTEVRRLMRDDGEYETEWRGQVARKCEALIEFFLAQSEQPVSDADPLNLAILFYKYGQLTMVSDQAHLALGNTARHHVATEGKRRAGNSEGGGKSGKTRQEEADQRKRVAKEIWEAFTRAGRQEHGLPQLVQDRLEGHAIHVSVDTVARWAREGGWRKKSKNRTK
ncbi:hypothetical protein [Onishia niordana]|uniref:hypothetical protein n=1 Tax=Onishia niordana TaxID=2508711 RepID=UPI00109F4D36|nr:hypothetical protein [Halomonas niordiana]